MSISCAENFENTFSCDTVQCASTFVRSANHFRYRTCATKYDRIACISIHKELSDDNCLQLHGSSYYTYGFNNSSVWVSDGCQSVFQVCSKTAVDATSTGSEMTNTPQTTTSYDDESSSSAEEIAIGVTTGVVALVLLVVTAILCLWIRRHKQNKKPKLEIQLQRPKTSNILYERDAKELSDNDPGKPTAYYINKDLVSVPLPQSSDLVGFSVGKAGPRDSYDYISTAAIETKNSNTDGNVVNEYNSLHTVRKTDIIPETPYDTCNDNVYNKLHEQERKVDVISSNYDSIS